MEIMQYISIAELLAIYPNINQNNQITDQDFQTYINLGSRLINNMTKRFIEKSIGITYALSTFNELSIISGSAEDNSEGRFKLRAIKESIAMLARFGATTGYDFLSGSMSASTGAISYSESIEYEESFRRVKKTAEENLAGYDFDNLLAGSTNLAIQDVNSVYDGEWIDSSSRPLTIGSLVNYLTDNNFITGKNGISIYKKDSTDPNLGIYIEYGGSAIQVDDTQITIAEGNYA